MYIYSNSLILQLAGHWSQNGGYCRGIPYYRLPWNGPIIPISSEEQVTSNVKKPKQVLESCLHHSCFCDTKISTSYKIRNKFWCLWLEDLTFCRHQKEAIKVSLMPPLFSKRLATYTHAWGSSCRETARAGFDSPSDSHCAISPMHLHLYQSSSTSDSIKVIVLVQTTIFSDIIYHYPQIFSLTKSSSTPGMHNFHRNSHCMMWNCISQTAANNPWRHPLHHQASCLSVKMAATWRCIQNHFTKLSCNLLNLC